MYCNQCQKDVAALNGVCPQCGQDITTTPPPTRQNSKSQEQNNPSQSTQQASQANQDTPSEFPPHIAYLDVPFRLQKAFMLIEKYKMHSPSGIMMTPQDKNNAPTFSEKMEMFSWLTFFFTLWYYLLTGMWRKALSILGISIAIAIIVELITIPYVYDEASSFLITLINFLINITLNIIWAKTAFYDRYRKIVKKEVFWW